MIDREDVAQREKRGEWRDRDDGGLGGEGAIPEGGDSLGAKYDGGASGGDEGRPTGEMRGAHGVDEGGLGREGVTPEGGDSLEVKYEGGEPPVEMEGYSWCRRGELTAKREGDLREE